MTIAALTADKAASKSLKLVKARAPVRICPTKHHQVFLAARYLAERASIAASIPRYDDMKRIWQGHDEQVDRALADLMEIING